MIVYRELSSIERDLGVSVKTLFALSNSLPRHYRKVQLPKKDGTSRTLYVPDEALKSVQRKIHDVLLAQMPVSVYATAYRPGGSSRRNACPHIGHSTVLKLDIQHFFDSILYSAVKDRAFPEEKYAEPIRILLSMLCYFRDRLPQGAPTSPAISNIILLEFDNTVGQWCRSRKIHYTRYCDDMTFSGDFVPEDVISFVRSNLRKYGFYLNEHKTVIARRGQRQSVTGIVVNEKLSIPADYRRKLRQQLYFCQRFGVRSHLEHTCNTMPEDAFIRSLLGKVNYVLSVSPDDQEFLLYRQWLKKLQN